MKINPQPIFGELATIWPIVSEGFYPGVYRWGKISNIVWNRLTLKEQKAVTRYREANQAFEIHIFEAAPAIIRPLNSESIIQDPDAMDEDDLACCLQALKQELSK